MNTSMAFGLELARDKAQYNEHAKRLLGNVTVLAWILKTSAPEFADIPIERIEKECIVRDIMISSVRLRPGETNSDMDTTDLSEYIIGDDTADIVPDEGRYS